MSDKITKKDIIDSLINETSVERQDVSDLFDLIFNSIKQSLSQGKSVELRGFGTFEPRVFQGRNYRNPQTGEQVLTKEHYVAGFRPGKELSDNMLKLELPSNEK